MANFPLPKGCFRPLMQPLSIAESEVAQLGFVVNVVFDDARLGCFWPGHAPDALWEPHPGWVNVVVRGGLVTQVCYGCD